MACLLFTTKPTPKSCNQPQPHKVIFLKDNNSNVYKTTLNGFATHQGTVRDTIGMHESQIGINRAFEQKGATFRWCSMIERHLRVAFYQGQTGPDKTPAPAGALSVKRHLKVAFSQTEARKASGCFSAPPKPTKGSLETPKSMEHNQHVMLTIYNETNPQIMQSIPIT